MIIKQTDFTLFTYDRYFIEENSLNVEARTIKINGRNGQGKTTFLQALFEGKWDGEMLIDGFDYKCNRKKLCSDFHFVYQEPYFVEDNPIDYTLALYGVSVTMASELLQEKIVDFDLKKNISKLSGGERQLINIVIGVLSEKKYLIIDEPFNNISKKNTKCIQEWLDQYDGSILLVDHSDEYKCDIELVLSKRKLYV